MTQGRSTFRKDRRPSGLLRSTGHMPRAGSASAFSVTMTSALAAIAAARTWRSPSCVLQSRGRAARSPPPVLPETPRVIAPTSGWITLEAGCSAGPETRFRAHFLQDAGRPADTVEVRVGTRSEKVSSARRVQAVTHPASAVHPTVSSPDRATADLRVRSASALRRSASRTSRCAGPQRRRADANRSCGARSRRRSRSLTRCGRETSEQICRLCVVSSWCTSSIDTALP